MILKVAHIFSAVSKAKNNEDKDSEFGPFMDFTEDDAMLKDDDFDFTGKILEAAAKNKEIQKGDGESMKLIYMVCRETNIYTLIVSQYAYISDIAKLPSGLTYCGTELLFFLFISST